MGISRKDLEHYVERLLAQMGADGVTLAVRDGDDWRIVTTEEEHARLRRLRSLLEYRAAKLHIMDQVDAIINGTSDSNDTNES